MSEIFVANLNFDTSDHELRALFEDFGPVKNARHIVDKETQRYKGFGFVTMETQADADRAIEALNGREFKKRVLAVRRAEPRQARPQGNYNRDDARESQRQQRYGGGKPNRRQNSW
jgi:RNA recognition motif-containing protein